MKRIMLPTFDYPPARGGVARYIGAILKTYPDQVKLLELGQKPKLISLVLRLLAKAHTYDAIWTHHVLPIGTAAMMAKKFTQKPYVVFLHGLDFDLARRNGWKRWLTKQVLSSAERVVTNSEALATEVREFVALDRLPLVVYPMLEDRFVELVKEGGSNRGKVNLQKLGELAVGVSKSSTPLYVSSSEAGDGILRLLTVSRLVSRKGHLKMLQAMLQLQNATYHIVGDGPMRSGLEKMIKSLGLEDRVRISPNVEDDDLPEVYCNADIFAMPTTKAKDDREGFGIVYLEAQLFGLPVIACKHPGVDEAVRDGEGGILIADSDKPDELVATIERLRDPAVRSKFGSRGRAWVEHEFTREQQMYKLRELL